MKRGLVDEESESSVESGEAGEAGEAVVEEEVNPVEAKRKFLTALQQMTIRSHAPSERKDKKKLVRDLWIDIVDVCNGIVFDKKKKSKHTKEHRKNLREMCDINSGPYDDEYKTIKRENMLGHKQIFECVFEGDDERGLFPQVLIAQGYSEDIEEHALNFVTYKHPWNLTFLTDIRGYRERFTRAQGMAFLETVLYPVLALEEHRLVSKNCFDQMVFWDDPVDPIDPVEPVDP